jgi:uncharacterized membrane protein YgcG
MSIQPKFVMENKIPTESALIGEFKKASSQAKKLKISKEIPAIFFFQSALAHQRKEDQYANASNLLSMETVSTKDKRELLSLLKFYCESLFLKEHGLSGSDELVLKKRNKQYLLQTYNKWISLKKNEIQQTNTLNNNQSLESEELSNIYKRIFSDVKIQMIDESTNKEADTHVFQDSFVLFLHEDYATELPVFGQTQTHGKMGKNGHIFCALGCVRDSSDMEITSLMAVAKSVNLPCVGANLGRTAEFTSKIIIALNAHAENKRLSLAVQSLPIIQTTSKSLLKQIPLRDKVHYSSQPLQESENGVQSNKKRLFSDALPPPPNKSSRSSSNSSSSGGSSGSSNRGSGGGGGSSSGSSNGEWWWW